MCELIYQILWYIRSLLRFNLLKCQKLNIGLLPGNEGFLAFIDQLVGPAHIQWHTQTGYRIYMYIYLYWVEHFEVFVFGGKGYHVLRLDSPLSDLFVCLCVYWWRGPVLNADNVAYAWMLIEPTKTVKTKHLPRSCMEPWSRLSCLDVILLSLTAGVRYCVHSCSNVAFPLILPVGWSGLLYIQVGCCYSYEVLSL